MFRLVKHKKRDGGIKLIAARGRFEMQDCGGVLFFPVQDKRKPRYTVLIDNDSLKLLVDDYLKHKEQSDNKKLVLYQFGESSTEIEGDAFQRKEE